jgi:hypothetical protein
LGLGRASGPPSPVPTQHFPALQNRIHEIRRGVGGERGEGSLEGLCWWRAARNQPRTARLLRVYRFLVAGATES